MSIIRVVDDIEGFKSLKPKWNEIIEQSQSVRVFQTFEWCYAAWTIYHAAHDKGGQLFILDVEREGRPEKGIFPFWVDRGKQLRFIGDNISDVCDVIAIKNQDISHRMVSDVVSFVKSNKNIKSIYLGHLLPDSDILTFFKVYDPSTRVRSVDAFSFLQLHRGEDFPSLLVHIGAKERSKVRSLAQKFKYSFKILKKEDGTVFPLDKIRDLRDYMCKSGYRVYQFFPDEMLLFIKDIYDHNLCEIGAFITEKGMFASVAFRLQIKDHINFWVMLYRDPKFTKPLTTQYMCEKIKSNNCLFDFGTGAYPYKLETFKPDIRLLFCVESHPISLSSVVQDIFTSFRILIKFWIIKMHLLPLFKKAHLAH